MRESSFREVADWLYILYWQAILKLSGLKGQKRVFFSSFLSERTGKKREKGGGGEEREDTLLLRISFFLSTLTWVVRIRVEDKCVMRTKEEEKGFL